MISKMLLYIATMFTMCFFLSPLQAKSFSLPVVYSNNYINIRSSVLFTEEQPFHLGDVLNLAVSLEFNADRVGIINLDETLLDDSWKGNPWIVHRGTPQVIRSSIANGLTRLEAYYQLQIIDCPNSGVPCPGGKFYPLSEIALGIEFMDDNGRVVSTEEIRFRPNPEFIALPSALALNNGRLESFNLYFPGRAFGLPISAVVNSTPSLILLIIGLLLISGMVVAPKVRAWLRHRLTAQIGLFGNRWEHVLDRLQDEALAVDEFQEGVRIAITWYCYDELKINPVHWSEKDMISEEDELGQLRTLYMQATRETQLSNDQRKKIVSQLLYTFKQ